MTEKTNPQLNKTQRRLLGEIHEIIDLCGLNPDEIANVEARARTAGLESVKDQYIRGEVIMAYVFMDEMLSFAMTKNFLGDLRKVRNTAKYKHFKDTILDKTYLVQKLEAVKSFGHFSENISKIAYEVNTVRNGLAHSFFPNNLARNRPIYKGKSLYTIDGFKIFVSDQAAVRRYFLWKYFRIRY